MIHTAGQVVMLKNIANGLAPISAIAIGDGAYDTTFNVPIAPSPGDTALRAMIYRDTTIQYVRVLTPSTGLSPRILFRHSFSNQSVPSIGRDISYINEVGLFALDPDSDQLVLVASKAFNNRAFRVPASGRSPANDIRTISWEVFGG